MALQPLPATRGASSLRVSPADTGRGGATFFHQRSLPALPVPALEDTLRRWGRTADALIDGGVLYRTEEERRRAKEEVAAAVQEFGRADGLGAVLQARLLEKQRRCHEAGRSWLIDDWNKYSYLAFRDSVVINVSYFYQFADDPRGGRWMTPAGRAASLISAAADFRDMLLAETLPADKLGRGAAAKPICMTMYRYLFNTCRMASATGEDHVNFFEPSENHEVLIVRRNRFFTFSTVDSSGRRLTPRELQHQVQCIVDIAGSTSGTAVGALTSAHRDFAGAAFRELLSDPRNEAPLAKIQQSMLAVCLDAEGPSDTASLARGCLHGDGRNRWYDKTLEFIVFENGKAGFIGEHSLSDGMPTATMTNWMLEGIAKGKLAVDTPSSARTDSLPTPSEQTFVVTKKVQSLIDDAIATHEAVIAAHDVVQYTTGWGKEQIKKAKVSPDAFVQMAFQVAYRRTYGYNVGTYEPAHARSFLAGRTACIRGLGPEALAFAEAMDSSSATIAERKALLVTATKAHSTKTKEAMMGQDVDRHLLGLKLCLEEGESAALFSHPAFGKSSYWAISTSNLSSEYYENWGWGQVVADGLGIAYSIQKNSLRFNVTSRAGAGAGRFLRQLKWALEDMIFVACGMPSKL